jgi:PAS domain S-box-containing protein/diguanylate cyclase (GGDEF)-like protein
MINRKDLIKCFKGKTRIMIFIMFLLSIIVSINYIFRINYKAASHYYEYVILFLQVLIYTSVYLYMLKLRQRFLFEELMRDISSIFTNSTDVDKEINYALSLIGQTYNLDKINVFLFSENISFVDNAYEWYGDGIEKRINTFKNISCSKTSWWIEELEKGNIIIINNIDKMLSNAYLEKQILKDQGVKSILTIPLINKDEIIGFLSYSTLKEYRIWKKTDSINLFTITNIVTSVLTKNKLEKDMYIYNLRINTLFENTLSPIVKLDRYGYFINANKSALDFFECTKEEITKKNIGYFCITDKTNKKIHINYSISSPESTEVYCNINGKIKYIILSIIPIDTSGQLNIYCIGQDITEQKNLEYNSKKNQEYYKSLIKYNVDGICSFDINRNIISVNYSIENITGYSYKDLINKNINEIFTPENVQFLEKYFNKVLRGYPQNFEIVIKHKNGNSINVNTTLVPIIVEKEIIGVFSVSKNITESKLIEEKLLYISYHDCLTNLYNRVYFDELLNNIDFKDYNSVGVIICGVDGLKGINNTLGYDTGDKILIIASTCIKESFGDDAIVCRIEGGKFSVILPNAIESDLIKYCNNIRENIAKYNVENPSIPLSMTIGYSVRNINLNIKELLKEAENQSDRS